MYVAVMYVAVMYVGVMYVAVMYVAVMYVGVMSPPLHFSLTVLLPRDPELPRDAV